MEIQIHKDAYTNFNDKAEDLILAIKEIILSKTKGFSPEVFVSHQINQEDIMGYIQMELLDRRTGNRVAKFFDNENKHFGLDGEDYQKFNKIVDQVYNIKTIKSVISFSKLDDFIFDWLVNRYKKNITSNMFDYIIPKCEQIIQPLEIWIPISMLFIESEIQLGKLVFKPITKEVFNFWKTKACQISPKDTDKAEELFNRLQPKIQGLAAAVFKIEAEPKRGQEIAIQESDTAISLLRLWCPTNLFIQQNTYCTLLGKENLKQQLLLVFENEGLQIIEEMIDNNIQMWIIDNDMLNIIQKNGLTSLNKILAKLKYNEFEEKLLECLILYSKSSLVNEISDKLVYMLTSLETILLKNSSESIIQNIGERLAFFISQDRDERKKIIDVIKKTYEIRSKFIHHGQTINDIETITEFTKYAHAFILNLILNSEKFLSKDIFIGTIENIKLS